VVTFSIFDSQTADYLFYLPDNFRLVRLWDNPDKDVKQGGDEDASPEATEEGGGDLGPVGGKKTPEADATKKTTSGDDDCAGYEDYTTASLENIAAWGEAVTSVDFRNILSLDPADITAAAETIRDLAKTQEDLDVPPAAADANALVVQAFNDSADALDTIAQGVADSDSAAIGQGASVISEIGTSFASGDVADAVKDLQALCG